MLKNPPKLTEQEQKALEEKYRLKDELVHFIIASVKDSDITKIQAINKDIIQLATDKRAIFGTLISSFMILYFVPTLTQVPHFF